MKNEIKVERNKAIMASYAMGNVTMQALAQQYGLCQSSIQVICQGGITTNRFCKTCGESLESFAPSRTKCDKCVSFRGKDALLSKEMAEQGKYRCYECKNYFKSFELRSKRNICKACANGVKRKRYHARKPEPEHIRLLKVAREILDTDRLLWKQINDYLEKEKSDA